MSITANLTTTVRNINPTKTLSFSFLPPHGKRLAPGEEYIYDGDLLSYLQKNKRKLAGFNAALLAGNVALVDTPNQHYYDDTLDMTKVLKVDNGAVTINNPSWGAYSSSMGGTDEV